MNLSLTELGMAVDRYKLEPTGKNKIAVKEALKALDREITFSKMSREELTIELEDLIAFQSDTQKLPKSPAREERLCIILSSINFVNFLLSRPERKKGEKV